MLSQFDSVCWSKRGFPTQVHNTEKTCSEIVFDLRNTPVEAGGEVLDLESVLTLTLTCSKLKVYVVVLSVQVQKPAKNSTTTKRRCSTLK